MKEFPTPECHERKGEGGCIYNEHPSEPLSQFRQNLRSRTKLDQKLTES